MRTKVAWVRTPEAIELIFLWLIYQPFAGMMSDALTGDAPPSNFVREPRRHYCGGDREWRAQVGTHIGHQIRSVFLGIYTNANIDIRRVCKRFF